MIAGHPIPDSSPWRSEIRLRCRIESTLDAIDTLTTTILLCSCIVLNSMVFYRMAMILAGVFTSLAHGAQQAPCPSHTVQVNLKSGGGVQSLTDAMNCTGAGVYNVTLHGRLQLKKRIEISAQKHITFTGYLDDAITGYKDCGVAAIDAGGTTGIFRVSQGSTLSIKDLQLRGGYSEDGGAVAVTSSSTFIASGCVFTNNSASTAGGEETLWKLRYYSHRNWH